MTKETEQQLLDRKLKERNLKFRKYLKKKNIEEESLTRKEKYDIMWKIESEN